MKPDARSKGWSGAGGGARACGARVALLRAGGRAGTVAARIRAEGGDAHALAADVADKRAVHGIA